MDINKDLEDILVQYNIINKTDTNEAINIIQNAEKEFNSGKRVALYGLGLESVTLLNFIEKYAPQIRFCCYFDKTKKRYSAGKLAPERDVNPIEAINDLDVDIVFIGARRWGNEMTSILDELGYDGMIIDLFAVLKEYLSNHEIDYLDIHNIKKARKEGAIADDEGLRQLIKGSYLIRDFVSAKNYTIEYVDKGYKNNSKYIECWHKIEKLLEEIKESIRKRKKHDVIINWVDAVSYYDLDGFPFLKELSKNSIFFENAYTVMPWTTETIKTILYGQYLIEGKLFEINSFIERSSPLKSYLDSKGYSLAYCGDPRTAGKFWSDTICPIGITDSLYYPSMIRQWDALAILVEIDTPVCIIIHNIYETHEPFVSAAGDSCIKYRSSKEEWRDNNLIKQSKASDRYLDRQLRFYEKLYSGVEYKIYMSDHGRIGNSPMDDNKTHTFLMVKKDNAEKKTIAGMFSLTKLYKLLEHLIERENDWDDLYSDFIWIENFDAYDPRVVDETIRGIFSREEMTQCRGVVTEKDSYFLYASGEEFYYINKRKGEKNGIGGCNEARVNALRRLCGREFIDIYKSEKFRYSRDLYKPGDIIENNS